MIVDMLKLGSRVGRLSLAVVGLMILMSSIALVRGHSVERESLAGEFAIPFQDYAGNKVFLSTFRHPILIVFSWASWCSYCSEEMTVLKDLKSRYGDSIRIVGINRGEPRTDAKSFSDTLALDDSMSLVLDPDDAFYKSIGGYAMPEFLFLDYRGEIVYRSRGPMTVDELENQIQAMR